MKKYFLIIAILTIVNTITQAQLSKDYQQIVTEYASKGAYKKAAEAIESWIAEVGPDYSKLYLLYSNLGTMQRRYGNKKEALNSYNKAFELNGESASVLSNRASLKRQLDDLEGSLKDYNEALKIETTESLLMNRSYTYKLMGDTLAAESDILKVLEMDKGNYMARTNLMNIWVDKGKYEEVLVEYDKMIKEHAGEAILYNNRADVLMKMKRYDQAMVDINKAIKMEKTYDNAYVTRAEIYIAKGDRKKALKDLQKAVKLGNNTTLVMSLIDECNRYQQ